MAKVAELVCGRMKLNVFPEKPMATSTAVERPATSGVSHWRAST